MLPALPLARQNSSAFTLPHPSPLAHTRTSSYRLTSKHDRERSLGSASRPSEEADEGEEDEDLRRELEMEMEEQGGEGLERERGLEDTLEKLGMGRSRSV